MVLCSCDFNSFSHKRLFLVTIDRCVESHPKLKKLILDTEKALTDDETYFFLPIAESNRQFIAILSDSSAEVQLFTSPKCASLFLPDYIIEHINRSRIYSSLERSKCFDKNSLDSILPSFHSSHFYLSCLLLSSLDHHHHHHQHRLIIHLNALTVLLKEEERWMMWRNNRVIKHLKHQ